MSKFGVLFGTALCAFVVLADESAIAGSAISLQTDQTQMIALASEPGTVVVGNPSIADISVNGKQVFLHGRAFGDTNIIILDANGNQMANFDVTVVHSANNDVAIYSARTSPDAPASRFTYSCDPTCRRAIIPGDEFESYKNIVAMTILKSGLATGSKTTDVTPGAAQPQ
jgi:Flp pilus assembly secretin CpaC